MPITYSAAEQRELANIAVVLVNARAELRTQVRALQEIEGKLTQAKQSASSAVIKTLGQAKYKCQKKILDSAKKIAMQRVLKTHIEQQARTRVLKYLSTLGPQHTHQHTLQAITARLGANKAEYSQHTFHFNQAKTIKLITIQDEHAVPLRGNHTRPVLTDEFFRTPPKRNPDRETRQHTKFFKPDNTNHFVTTEQATVPRLLPDKTMHYEKLKKYWGKKWYSENSVV